MQVESYCPVIATHLGCKLGKDNGVLFGDELLGDSGSDFLRLLGVVRLTILMGDVAHAGGISRVRVFRHLDDNDILQVLAILANLADIKMVFATTDEFSWGDDVKDLED